MDETDNKISQAEGFRNLSKLEWFGLISGIIGLIADVISLSALFKISQSQEPTSLQLSPFVQWVIIFFAVSYTVLVISYFTHRVKLGKYSRKNSKSFSNSFAYRHRQKREIEGGVAVVTYLFGVPLYSLLFLVLYFIISENLLVMDAENLKYFVGETDSFKASLRFGTIFSVLSITMSFLLTSLMNYCGKTIYSSFNR